MGYFLAFLGSTLASLALVAYLRPSTTTTAEPQASVEMGAIKITAGGRTSVVDPITGESYEVMPQSSVLASQEELAAILASQPDKGGS